MKKSIILNLTTAALVSIIPVTSIVSCANSTTSNLKNDQFYQSFTVDSIITEESFDNVIEKLKNSPALFDSNISQEEFEKGMKTVFEEELVIDKDSQLYKELKESDKLSEFESKYIGETYNALMDEIKNENLNNSDKTKHWTGLFSKHTWDYVRVRAVVFRMELLVALDVVMQFVPPILEIVNNRDFGPLIDALTDFGNVMPPTRWLIKKTLEYATGWKDRTKCTSTFTIWGISVW